MNLFRSKAVDDQSKVSGDSNNKQRSAKQRKCRGIRGIKTARTILLLELPCHMKGIFNFTEM